MARPPKKEFTVVQTSQPTDGLPHEFQHLLDWIRAGLERMENIEDAQTREEVFALLEGIDVLHRQALARLLKLAGDSEDRGLVGRLTQDPVTRTLLEMYDLPEPDERTQVERALEPVYPYFQSHGGRLDLLGVENGRVRVRLSGSCEGCPGTATTLERVVEEALREGFPGFEELVAEEPPARNEPIQLGRRPLRRPRWSPAGRTEDLEPGALRSLQLENTPVLLAHLDGGVYAYRNGCPPGSALTLHLGSVEGTTLVCPWHGCRYDLRTGKQEDGEGKLPVLPVAVRDGEIKVALSTEEVAPE